MNEKVQKPDNFKQSDVVVNMTEIISKGPFLGVRHLQVLLLFLNIMVIFISRSHISVSNVAMTNAATTNPDFPEYNWSEKEKSYILCSFYLGYMITQFPGGYLSRRFGAKVVMLYSTFGSALFSFISPFFIHWGGWEIFCLLQLIQGLFQGVIFPCIHEHLAKWAPIPERNRLGALSHTGIECGSLLAPAISGLIAHSSMGWPGISYISAAMCLVWCVLWCIFGANNVTASKLITTEERNYIESSLQRTEGYHNKQIPIPWVAIFTSVPFCALLVIRCAGSWVESTLQSLPLYFNGILKMHIKDNGLFSSLPYLAMWILSFVYLIIAEVSLKRKWTSLTVLRKTFNTIAFWTPAVGLVGVCFLDKNESALAIVIMTISIGVMNGERIGSTWNTIDLSPNHAGMLMGIVNCIASFMKLLRPLVTCFLITHKSNASQWQIVFLISAVVLFCGNLCFLIYGRTDTQPWNDPDFLLMKKKVEKRDEA